MTLILTILLGLLIGLLSSLSGLGGGFLIVPYLLYLGKHATHAVGTSFMVILLVAASSLIAHSRLGHVDFRTGICLAIGGLIGAQIGPQLLQEIPEVLFKRAFSLILVGIGVWMFWSTRNAA